MFRLLIILLASILLISVLRVIIGVIMRGFTDMVSGGSETTASTTHSRSEDVPLAGELKRDPVCGTFVSAATSLKTTAHGETVYFCSAECRDKYRRV